MVESDLLRAFIAADVRFLAGASAAFVRRRWSTVHWQGRLRPQ